MSEQRLGVPTSPVHMLKVSISLDAHTAGEPPRPCIQPACAMLQPQLPTCMHASSSSGSSAFDVLSRPSDEMDRRTLRVELEGRERRKCTAVMSSECV